MLGFINIYLKKMSKKTLRFLSVEIDLDRERELSREDGRIYTSPFLFFSMTIWKRNQYDR